VCGGVGSGGLRHLGHLAATSNPADATAASAAASSSAAACASASTCAAGLFAVKPPAAELLLVTLQRLEQPHRLEELMPPSVDGVAGLLTG
jgi:hypothetical protein